MKHGMKEEFRWGEMLVNLTGFICILRKEHSGYLNYTIFLGDSVTMKYTTVDELMSDERVCACVLRYCSTVSSFKVQ